MPLFFLFASVGALIEIIEINRNTCYNAEGIMFLEVIELCIYFVSEQQKNSQTFYCD